MLVNSFVNSLTERRRLVPFEKLFIIWKDLKHQSIDLFKANTINVICMKDTVIPMIIKLNNT